MNKADWAKNKKFFAEAESTWIDNSKILYSDNYQAFEEAYNKAKTAREKNGGKPVIPYMKENALGGFAKRGSGQGFGVEVEYEFDKTLSPREIETLNNKIGNALYRAVLTSSTGQRGYGEAKEKGYRSTLAGNWSFEDDGSINGGEIVSPIMYDEGETWDNLEKVCKILKKYGAIATANAGSHVHVGTGKLFGNDPKKYTELTRLFNQHEDVLYRIASDTSRGTHRGGRYSKPIDVLSPKGFTSISSVSRNWERNLALNLNNVEGKKNDHSEFRIHDASLDPGTIQSQIKVSVAMAQAANHVVSSGIKTKRPKEPLGIHEERKELVRKIKKTEVTLEEESTSFRSFLDTLFVRPEDKEQLVAVYANTEWAKVKSPKSKKVAGANFDNPVLVGTPYVRTRRS